MPKFLVTTMFFNVLFVIFLFFLDYEFAKNTFASILIVSAILGFIATFIIPLAIENKWYKNITKNHHEKS